MKVTTTSTNNAKYMVVDICKDCKEDIIKRMLKIFEKNKCFDPVENKWVLFIGAIEEIKKEIGVKE